MHHVVRLQTLRRVLLASAVLLAPAPTTAGEDATGREGVRSDPCGFFRGQAYGRGLEDPATEMLWACETIASRRAAEMTLSERLVAVELALERYRTAVVEAGAAAFARNRADDYGSGYFGAGDAAKADLAESTGMTAALDAIRAGF